MEFDNDHLKRLDSLCLLDENTLIDNMCLNINDINFLLSFIMRNKKPEVSQDCLIFSVNVESAVKEIVDTIFLNNLVNIPSEPFDKRIIMREIDKYGPLMKTIDRFLFGSASFLLQNLIFSPILQTKDSKKYWSASVFVYPIKLLCHKKEV